MVGAETVWLQIVDEGHHPVALVRIWQAAAHCTEIVGHVRWVRGTGNNCRHPFISEQVFEKKLRPAAGEVLSPIRNRPAAHGAVSMSWPPDSTSVLTTSVAARRGCSSARPEP